jgi:hypothetical protein
MSEISLRDYAADDPPRVLKWYQKDRSGFESFMGASLPDELACTLAMNTLLQAASNGLAIFRMVACDDDTIGFTGVTTITPDLSFGQPHLYIAPPFRKHSVRAARCAEDEARKMGLKYFQISVEDDNRRGLAMAKHLRYQKVPRVAFTKEL